MRSDLQLSRYAGLILTSLRSQGAARDGTVTKTTAEHKYTASSPG